MVTISQSIIDQHEISMVISYDFVGLGSAQFHEMPYLVKGCEIIKLIIYIYIYIYKSLFLTLSNDVDNDICVAVIHRENYNLINLFHYCEEIVISIIVINIISAWSLSAPVVQFWNIIWWIAYALYPVLYNLCKLLFIYTYDTDIPMWIA